MQMQKQNEQNLTLAFERQVHHTALDNLRYEFFDMHLICKNSCYDRLNPLIEKINDVSEVFGFFAYNQTLKKVELEQNGVFRVNCLDCLDRSNIFMTKLFAHCLQQQMKRLGIDFRDRKIFAENAI
jgi:hypothetical protein